MAYPVDRDGRTYDEYRHEILDDHELYELDRFGGHDDQRGRAVPPQGTSPAGHPTRKETP